MNLQSIEQLLLKQLQQDGTIEVKQQMHYAIPIHTIEVSYHPVMRSAMDILMKMMLLSFQKAKLKNAELLAEILLVEPLFIHDLTSKMLRLGMIEKEEFYTLTAKGQAQLQAGIFEEELEEASYFVQYSPVHESVMEGDLEQFEELEHFPELFPTIEEEDIAPIEEQRLISYIQHQLATQPLAEGELPHFITSVVSSQSVQINDVPVICFFAYHEQENRHFTRVYNTLTGEWDAKLEDLLVEFHKQ